MNNVNYADQTFNELNVIGEAILVKKLRNDDLRCVDGIYIPESDEYKNEKIGVGQILELTKETAEKYGINKDDYVLYDYYSANGDFKNVIITKAENILMKMNEDEANNFLNGSSLN